MESLRAKRYYAIYKVCGVRLAGRITACSIGHARDLFDSIIVPECLESPTDVTIIPEYTKKYGKLTDDRVGICWCFG